MFTLIKDQKKENQKAKRTNEEKKGPILKKRTK